jgi:hypothetical protein
MRKSITESLRRWNTRFNAESAEGFINIVAAILKGSALFRNMGYAATAKRPEHFTAKPSMLSVVI